MEDTQTKRTFWCAGWRPAAGWICVVTLGWGWIIAPIIEVILRIYHVQIELPKVDASQVMPLITTLLGMATLRTYDKKNNLTS